MRVASAAVVAVALVVAACATRFQTGAGGLRTYAVDGSVLCNLGLDVNPPTGVVAGAPADIERIWLVGDDGARISVAWPEGFSVEFSPDVVLRDERGQIIARAGDIVELQGANEFPGDGSFENPYIPYKAFGCHPPRT